MSILDNILTAKRAEIASSKARVPQSRLEQLVAARRDSPRGFAAALDAPGVRVIAELKRASPSRGDIRRDLDAAETARTYAYGGAAALSVLTDAPFFKGSPEDLRLARAATGLPVLRKDFIISTYQVYESCAMGADAILLIVRVLDDETFEALHRLALGLGLDVLTEVYDGQDVERANRIGARLVGVNNRNLADFRTDVRHTERMVGLLRPGVAVVALSGISSDADVSLSLAAGVRRFLVGEALVRASDPAALLRQWIALPEQPV